MSHLKYASTPGFGEVALQETHYSQAVRVPAGDVITISGQGGWDPKSTPADPLPSDLNTEITQVKPHTRLQTSFPSSLTYSPRRSTTWISR